MALAHGVRLLSLRLLSPVAALVCVCAAPLHAEAGAERAWAAAKVNLPASTKVVVGLNLAALTKSSLFSMAMPLVLGQQPDLKAGLELVKSACGIDPLKTIQGVVVGMDADQKHGAMFVAVTGLDQPKLLGCLESIAKARNAKAVFSAKPDGSLTAISLADKDAPMYLTWIGKDVIALPLQFTSKDDLTAWQGNKKGLAKAAVARATGKVNTGAAVWAVSAVPKELDASIKMKLGYGAITTANRTLSADLHIQLASAAAAKTAADKASKDLTAAASTMADNLKALLGQISVTAEADELVIKGGIPEGEVLSLVGALMSQ